MTAQERDVEDILARVLHSATDHVEPVGDGLTKIRERLTEPWLTRQWWLLRSEFTMLSWFVVVRCESFVATVRTAAAATSLVASAADADDGAAAAGHGRRLRLLTGRLAAALGGIAAWISAKAAGGGQRRSPGPVINWLRPALAVAGAVVLVVAGVFALGQIREGIVSLSNGAGGTPPGTSGQSTGSGVTTGRSGVSAIGPAASRTGPARTATGHRPGAHASQSPCASPPASPAGSPSPSPSSSPPPSPTPSPSATPTPTPTTSPSASPTPTSSGASLSAYRAVRYRTTALVCVQASPASSPSGQSSPA
jgi:hypothetical protein